MTVVDWALAGQPSNQFGGISLTRGQLDQVLPFLKWTVSKWYTKFLPLVVIQKNNTVSVQNIVFNKTHSDSRGETVLNVTRAPVQTMAPC